MGGADDLAVVILAAGKGTRMRSRLPKVLHAVCGRPIVRHLVLIARELGADRIVVVVGSGEEEVRDALAGDEVETVVQDKLLGTAHAALQARELLADHPGPILLTYGDHALYRVRTFEKLLEAWRERDADLALLVSELPDPTGYGRIVRGPDGEVERIVEEGDANAEIRAIRECNLGTYLARGPLLFDALARVGSDNVKGEFYLTDVVELCLREGRRVATARADDWRESLGINDRAELAAAERILRQRICERWMSEGVTFIDPDHSYVDADVEIGPDTLIEPGCALRGRTRVGAGSRISAGSVVEDSTLGKDCWIKPHCWIESSVLGERCAVGPSAHIRPGVRLEDDVRLGNFVEVKNSTVGRGTKADHLSYIGDADVGADVTIACGAITVNYDGRKKSRTIIGDRAFVGCNSNLIAPLEIEPDAFVAAGSTITRDVPVDALGVARARQRNIKGWRKRRFHSEDS